MPIWRARGSQPSSVTLRVAPSSAPSSVAQRLERVVLVGRDAAADADDRVRASASASRSSSRVRASTRTRLARRRGDRRDRAATDVVRAAARRRQHAGAHGRHLDRRVGVDRGDELAAERGLPRDERGRRVDLEVDRVAGESGAEPRRDA